MRRIARGNIDDGIADGFPNDAAPAGFERAVRLVGGVGRRPGGDPERIGGFDAGEIDGEICHRSSINSVLVDDSASNSGTRIGLSKPEPTGAPFTPKRDGWTGPPLSVRRRMHECRARLSCLRPTALTTSRAAVGAIAAGENFRQIGLAGFAVVHDRAAFIQFECRKQLLEQLSLLLLRQWL